MRICDSVRASVAFAAILACPPMAGAMAETPRPSPFAAPLAVAALDQPVSTAGAETVAGSPIAVALDRALSRGGFSSDEIAEIRAAYADGAPIWLSAGRAEALTTVLAEADDHALPASRYQADALADRLGRASSLTEAERWVLEADMTAAFAQYARDMSSGLLEPSQIDPEIEIFPSRPSYGALLREVALTEDAAALLRDLAPDHAAYAALKAALVEARAVDPDAWGPEVPAGRTLKYGMRNERVAALRARLTALGFAPAPDADGANPDPLRIDRALEDSIIRFQADRGLDDDGIVGSRTLAALNQSPRERIAQIAVNMERLRWHNRDLGWRHILVNQAAFSMTLFENASPVLESRVIVGKAKKHRTPEFSDEMEFVVFNPYWNVPKSIAREEILPLLKSDPSYLDKNNMTATPWNGYSPPPPPSASGPMSMSVQPGAQLAQRDLNAPYNPALERAREEARLAALADLRGETGSGGEEPAAEVEGAEQVEQEPEPPYNPWTRYSESYFPYTIRQNPGDNNALGHVKFLFPNHHAIYLHDTPSRNLFQRERRDFSHGCVRVQKPMELAETLLGWERDEPADFMAKMLAYTEEKWIRLKAPVPVHLTYRTAQLNSSGLLDFLPDVYGRDDLVAAALEADGVALR